MWVLCQPRAERKKEGFKGNVVPIRGFKGDLSPSIEGRRRNITKITLGEIHKPTTPKQTMSLFTILDEINQAWEADKAAEAEYAHFLEVRDNRRHPEHYALFVHPKGKYYQNEMNHYDSIEGYYPLGDPHPFIAHGAPEPRFPAMAAECFKHVNYRINHSEDTTMMEEWLKNPHDEGMLGFLRAIIHMDDPKVEVINCFFGHEHESMMFTDIPFPNDKKYHHLSWEDPPIGFTIERRVEYNHEFLNKANQVLNSNGMPSGEVRSTTLDLLAKEWEKGCGSDRGHNPELLEMMVQRFYRNMTPVAYAVLHQTMMMTFSRFVGPLGFDGSHSLKETVTIAREVHDRLANTGVLGEFYLSETPCSHDEFQKMDTRWEHYAKHQMREVAYRQGVPGRIVVDAGDFHITTDKMWIRHNSKYYEMEPDYATMGEETAEVYQRIFHKVFRAVRT